MSESTQSESAEFNEALAYQESEEEAQLWMGAYSIRKFLPALIVGLPITGMLFALARFFDPDDEGGFVRYGVEGILAVGWLVLLGIACWRVLGTEYMLTNKRLYCRRGFGHPGLPPVDLGNLCDVRVQQAGLERWLGVGSIFLPIRGQTDLSCKLGGITDPERVAGIFRKQLRALRQSE
jgi:hypothetical protein